MAATSRGAGRPDEPWFEDVTERVGLVDPGCAVWGDYDNDGWVDLYTNGAIYHNEEGARFCKVQEVGGHQGTWGDYNNDGYLDLVVWGDGCLRLFTNKGDGTFAPAKACLPAVPTPVVNAACWADLNGDGLLDLYIAGGGRYDQRGVLQEAYPDVIYVNRGDGTFCEHWRTPCDERMPARGVTAADFDEDGNVEIYVSNYNLCPNHLWRVERDLGLAPLAFKHGVAGNLGYMWQPGGLKCPVYGHTIGSAWGDLDNDGHIDLFVSNVSHPDHWAEARGLLHTPNCQDGPMFLRNQGPPDFHFEDKSREAGLHWQEYYGTPALGDFDNDGYLDLYLTAVDDHPPDLHDHCVLYHNEGNWHFKDVTAQAASCLMERHGYAAGWADYDNDGALDLLTGGKLYRNRCAKGHWLKFRLEGPGSAIGAQVRVQLGDQTLTRQVESSTGQGNQNDMTLHFGLGDHEEEVTYEVRWLGGASQVGRSQVDRTVRVVQNATAAGG